MSAAVSFWMVLYARAMSGSASFSTSTPHGSVAKKTAALPANGSTYVLCAGSMPARRTASRFLPAGDPNTVFSTTNRLAVVES